MDNKKVFRFRIPKWMEWDSERLYDLDEGYGIEILSRKYCKHFDVIKTTSHQYGQRYVANLLKGKGGL